MRNACRPEKAGPPRSTAARELLLEEGPQAVTLKAVAARIGRTHANLLHHFGIGRRPAAALAEDDRATSHGRDRRGGRRARAAARRSARVVDVTFDAFAREGAGALVGWMILTGKRDALDRCSTAIRDSSSSFRAAGDDRPMDRGDAVAGADGARRRLLGDEIAARLGLPREAAREIAVEALRAA